MVNMLAGKLATGIKKNVPDAPQSVEVLKYAISFILNALFIIASSLLISLFTGRVHQAIIILIGYALLRQVSGGVHLQSGSLCIVVSTAGVTALSFISFNTNVLFLFTAISLVLALVYAPSRIDKQTRIPAKYYPLLKLISLIIISSSFIIGSAALASAFLLQSLTLIRRKEVLHR